MILPETFYQRDDVVQIARELLGKYLVTNFNGEYSAGMIIETEAYAGVTDRASHAWGGRLTNRTEVMYRNGGIAYIYLCYGMHSLFNIVTNKDGTPHAILIRGIRPAEGLDIMLQRSNRLIMNKDFGSGPGKVSKIMGIHYLMSGLRITNIDKNEPSEQLTIWIEDRGKSFADSEIVCTPRIGVDYAGEDAKLPWRFLLKT